jgi:DNA replication protein DnaC
MDVAMVVTGRKVCERHGEYEVLAQQILGRTTRIFGCPKCAAEAEAHKAEAEALEEEKRRRRAWEVKMEDAGIPERFRTRTLSTYAPLHDGQRRALDFARSYAEGFSGAQGQGALFLGLPGTGKTHLAVGIALELMQQGRRAAFCTVMRAVRAVKESWRRDATQTESKVIQSLVSPDLLILDEVGVQFGSEAEKLILFDVLNERYERCKATLLLSNLTAPEVRDYLGERVMDRLREDGGKVLVFDWASYRGAERGC